MVTKIAARLDAVVHCKTLRLLHHFVDKGRIDANLEAGVGGAVLEIQLPPKAKIPLATKNEGEFVSRHSYLNYLRYTLSVYPHNKSKRHAISQKCPK
jgi:hypothetical protein